MPEGAIYAVQKQVRTITVAVGLVSIKVLDTYDLRKGLIIYNNSNWSVYITFGVTATLDAPTKIIAPYSDWDVPGPAEWVGEFAAIREGGTGELVFTEFI
jgi:hypothetical protein